MGQVADHMAHARRAVRKPALVAMPRRKRHRGANAVERPLCLSNATLSIAIADGTATLVSKDRTLGTATDRSPGLENPIESRSYGPPLRGTITSAYEVKGYTSRTTMGDGGGYGLKSRMGRP